MNLLLINYEYPPVGAGAATATQQIARALRRLGHRPVVLTARFGDLAGTSDEEGIRVVRIASRRKRRESSSPREMASFILAAGPMVRALVRQERIDGIIAFFSIPGGPLAWWAARPTRIPYVVSLRGGDVPGTEPGLRRIHGILAGIRRLILRRASKVVANSEGLKKLSEAADPVPVIVIPNGVDTAFFRPPVQRPDSGETPFRILFVGRFQEQKNLGWLLREFAILDRELPDRLTLDLVGSGPLEASLKNLAEKLGIASRLRWHGWTSRADLRAFYQAASVLVNPSRYEGMPNVVLEAMACGLPVVASAVAGNDAVVRDGETGFLVPLDDPESLRTALRRLQADPVRACTLGRAARVRAETEFSWSRVAQSYLELFEPRR